jgi:hypothetical protein
MGDTRIPKQLARLSTHVSKPKAESAPSASGPVTSRAGSAASSSFTASPPRSGAADDASLAGVDATSAQAKLTAISRLMSGPTSAGEEKQILDLLRAAPKGELNYLVSKLDTHELMEDVDNHLFGPKNRDALVSLLCTERAGDLSVGAKVSLINGMQQGRTEGFEEKAVRDLFLSTKGADLTALKNGIDAGGDFHDLQQLVFSDIDDAGVRQQILDHIQREASPAGAVKVLSDIDDTLYENLKDSRYPKKTVYPGVVEFYKELENGRTGNLTFVTARPGDPAGLIEGLTEKTLKGKGVPEATILTGNLISNLSNNAIADEKFKNFTQYQQLFPEYGYVFTGDSGQGDAIFGAKMREAAPSAVKAVFINDVVNTPQDKRDQARAKGVFFNDTYVGAAVEAFKLGLISRDGLQRVASAASDAMAKIPFEDPAQQKARQAELDRDLDAAKRALAP